MQDQTLTCKDCGNEFVWTVGEQQFYKDKGFDNPPSRCPDCRTKKKADMAGSRKDYPIVCSNCGKEDTVPFEPKEGGKPVLCRECFKKNRQA